MCGSNPKNNSYVWNLPASAVILFLLPFVAIVLSIAARLVP